MKAHINTGSGVDSGSAAGSRQARGGAALASEFSVVARAGEMVGVLCINERGGTRLHARPGRCHRSADVAGGP
eukprot:4157118-Pyramimonas_sp.AAC.1